MAKNTLIILISIFVLNCKTINSNSVEMKNDKSTLIAKGNLYGDGAEGLVKQNMIITTSNAWNNLLTKMNAVNTVSNNFSETDIDFTKYKIVAVFDDIKSTGGHRLDLKINSDSKNTIVTITNTGPDGFATTVITQPFHIVKIMANDLPIIFK